ncbi:hypothetical protein NDK47_20095 [Brevibacillus ruminantium]|uniref:Nucleotide kinase n=1 Tax=Brevibacillus ruminantium TaxID=2950604 RepID=A0ABY4WGH5_9BACL|nr:hypothetical protein [Brevibacillus ruminantium]USG64429.1 hypothetical protein NDK47_20095 [Brevibacillus ruminantium]
MNQRVRHIYAGGNTARGYRSFLDSVLSGITKRIVLTGDVEGLPSSLIQAIGEKAVHQVKLVEWIHSPFVTGAIDGVVIPEWKAAVVDGSYPRQLKPQAPGLREIYVDLQRVVSKERLVRHKDDILALQEKVHVETERAQHAFAEALRVHEEWESVFIAHLDREQANRVCDEVLRLFFGDAYAEKESTIRRMYLGAATPEGPHDFVPNLTEVVPKRYLIKGRPGSGKSTILKRLVAEAEQRGFDAEVYHCGLDPNSLDMVVVPERGLAIFDSTAPHEYFAERDSDEIIDMYARAIAPGTDEKYKEKLEKYRVRYKEATKKGTAHLKEAQEARLLLSRLYLDATDQERVAEIRAAIVRVLDV